jgi:hypothetical protein
MERFEIPVACRPFRDRAGGFMKIVMLAWLILAAGGVRASAQEHEPASVQEPEIVLGPEFEQRFDELAKWFKDYEAWEKWFEAWGNRVVHNFDDQPIWQRMTRPEPPVWLEAECRDHWFSDGLVANACYILRHWEEQPLLILQRRSSSLQTSGGKVNDEVAKGSLFRRVHLTGLWMEARYPGTPTYGIVGMQFGVFESGRLTLPAVGVMLVMLPDGKGGHALTPATTVGFGYRMVDFVAPLIRRQLSLYLNVARTHLHGVQSEGIVPRMNVNLFGLSVSARRRR